MNKNIKHPNIFRALEEELGHKLTGEELYKTYLLLKEEEFGEAKFDELEEEDAEEIEAALNGILETKSKTFYIDSIVRAETIYIVGGRSYFIFTYDEAAEIAEHNIISLLEEEGLGVLNKEYRESLIYNARLRNDLKLNGLISDLVYDDIDGRDDEEVREFLLDYIESEEVEALNLFEMRERAEELLYDIIEAQGFIEYLEELFEDNISLLEFLIDNYILTLEDIAEDMTDIDGLGHFIADYDGRTIELDWMNSIDAYRID